MKTFKDITERTEELDTVTIKCRDHDGVIKKLIDHIGKCGNGGHFFSIIVDPEGDDTETFGWDGDGAAYIKSVEHTKSK